MVAVTGNLTNELGSAISWGPGGTVSPFETNPELYWPHSMSIYDKMRSTDSQIRSLLQAIARPILKTAWQVQGSEVRSDVIDVVERELGLQTDQEGRFRRSTNGFSWDEFLRQALTFLPFGHSVFEPIYAVDDAVHLSRMAFRPQRTIAAWNVANDGSLESIEQYVTRKTETGWHQDKVAIPAEKLVVFVNEREGADWAGQSILRACYINWLMKSQIMRYDAMAIERNGMGLPVLRIGMGEDANKAQRVVEEIRMGERAGVVLPDTQSLELLGVSGTTKDAMPSLNFHNQEIGRSALAMFLNLGHDRGSQSLGETFEDLFVASLNAVSSYVEEVVTEGIIRPLVRYNFGPDEPYPVVTADELTTDTALSPEQLKYLVDASIITPDGELEDDMRRRFALPPREDQGPTATVEVPLSTVDPLATQDQVQATPLAASHGGLPVDQLRQRIAYLQAQLEARP